MVLPMPIKFINSFFIVLNFISLSYPCISIKIPKPNLNTSIAVLKAPAEYFVESSFFILF